MNIKEARVVCKYWTKWRFVIYAYADVRLCMCYIHKPVYVNNLNNNKPIDISVTLLHIILLGLTSYRLWSMDCEPINTICYFIQIDTRIAASETIFDQYVFDIITIF